MGGDCKESEALFACYSRGQMLRTPSPATVKKSRKSLPSPGKLGEPHPTEIHSTALSPVTPKQNQAAQQSPLAAAAATVNAIGVRTLSKELSPGVFYGSPAGDSSNTPIQVRRLLRQIRRDCVSSEKEQVRAPATAIWATFPRQDQAIQFADSHGNTKVAVFVFQDHVTGQRRFLATTVEEFWKRYEKMPPALRHHYELVREGFPCHLYFDLEFNCKANPEANGQTMVDLLLSVAAEAFDEVYSLKYEATWTVELDSSTNEKFSRHVIVRAPKVAFKDNSHVGGFVSEICAKIERMRSSTSELDRIFVLKGDSRSDHHAELFVDKGVYSRNRSFRLPFSSKAGKTAVLRPTSRFRCYGMNDRQVFMDSLICRIDDDCDQVLTFGLEVPDRGRALNFTGYPANRGAFHASGKSPFPDLDVVVETIASVDNVPGTIRSWYWFAEYLVMVYNISGNRYCENIGRQHKSNNVMYLVDFRTAGYYQKCHDPDCRGYRSPLRPIPRDVIPPQFPLSTAEFSTAGPSQSSQDATSSCGSSVGKGSQRGRSEDQLWWDAVISSMASVECGSQPETADEEQEDHHLLEHESSDESWWLAVESVAADLEERIFGSTGTL